MLRSIMLAAIPLLAVFAILAFFAGLFLWAKRFIKVSPDQVAVITGRKRKNADGSVVGYRIVRGGATFVWPIREEIKYLPLNLMTVPVDITKAYNKDGVPISVEAIANIKIKGEDQAIANAVERFLGKAQSIEPTARQTLEGHLRTIVGTMTVEELNSDRKAFAKRVTEESTVDLERMGLTIDSFVIKRITDEHGYLEALGIRRTAEVKRDADIGRANAEAESKKKTSEAAREAEEVFAQNQIKIADAQKKLKVQQATYNAEVQKEEAIASQAGPKAQAEAEKDVLIARQNAKAAETEAASKVQEQEALRRQYELDATVVKKAQADATAKVAEAEADKHARKLKAEATAIEIEEKGKADAAAIRAKLEAEAEGIRAKLTAEADGKEKLAEALKKLNEAGQLLFLMEKSPEVLKALGEAGGEIAKNIFGPLAAPLGSIDNLTVYDSGGSGNGKGAVTRVANIVPDLFFEFINSSKARGLGNLADVVQQFVAFASTKLASSSASADNKAPKNNQEVTVQ